MNDAERLRAELERVARTLGAPDGTIVVLERPRDPAFGDWATNLAMTLAKPLGRKPRDIAQDVVNAIDKQAAGVKSAEIAGPGFINLRLDANVLGSGLARILDANDRYGRSEERAGEHVNVEFVSANPTGPLHVGHGRQAALGDAIATLLEWAGATLSREFYYNDGGAQIENLALSVQARVREIAGVEAVIPEGGYQGEYIREVAQQYVAEHPVDAAGAELDAIRAFAVRALRKEQDIDLQAFGVRFDTYFLESSLYSEGRVERTVNALVAAGHAYEKDGALWLRTTAFGDDKDRVMRKSDGTFTYFVPDVAYHVTKWERGFRHAINVQGSDHHSTVNRVRIGLQALEMGIRKDYPDYVLHSMVTVLKSGEEVKISKRAGSYVTVRELVDEVGRDAVRWFFLMRKGESQLSFDVDLARSQSEENPVYYVQMAHARMVGIFRKGEIRPEMIVADGADLTLLGAPEEVELIKALLDFPALVKGAADAREPHRVANYLHDMAGLAHGWYHKHHVLDEPDPIMRARLVLARATQIVLRNGLQLLGVSAPERM